MLTDEEIKHIEKEIRETIELIEKTYVYELLPYEREEAEEEFPGLTESWIKDKIKDLYRLIKAYLEAKGMTFYLTSFQQQYEHIISDEKFDFFKGVMHHPDAEFELDVITEFKRHLKAFKAFSYRQEKEAENIRLLNILKHTDHILKNVKAVVETEADIYKQVKWVLGLYYPRCRTTNKAAFVHQFKTYNPDILIPELKTAIEFKYLRTRRENIDNYIDQVKVDATNYTGDPLYENFIAVLYINDTAIATHESIQMAWQQKKFPNNWDLVIAMGSK